MENATVKMKLAGPRRALVGLGLLGVVCLLALPAAAQPAALDVINGYVSDQVHPAKLSQVYGIDREGLDHWLRHSAFSASERAYVRATLRPVLAQGELSAVLLWDVARTDGGGSANVALVVVPKSLRAAFDGAQVLTLVETYAAGDSPFDDETPELKSCRYKTCNCWNPSSCACDSATYFVFGGDCNKTDECSSAEDCGDGGNSGHDSGPSIVEVVGAF